MRAGPRLGTSKWTEARTGAKEVKTTGRAERLSSKAFVTGVQTKQGHGLRTLEIQQGVSAGAAEAGFNLVGVIDPTSALGVDEGKRGGQNMAES